MDKSLLSRATNKDDNPTPGYLFGEIARMTQHSYETSNKVMEYLVSRVKNKHHNIKYKALVVIKHTCRDGRQDFRREMQKYVPNVKECLQFRGPPDELKGDEYYRRVRDAAKECLDAIFDNSSSSANMAPSGISSRIQGVGSVVEETNTSSGWTGKLGWGNSSNSNTGGSGHSGAPTPGYGGPNASGYGGPNASGYGGPNASGYGGPNASGYGGSNASGYGGPSASGYGGSNASGYGGPSGYGGQPPPAPHDGQYGGRMAGIGNPMYQDARNESKGFLAGLKEKAASTFTKNEAPKPTFSGAPPGAHNPPEGWSFATNRGPTGGNYAPQGRGYNPDESSYGHHNTDNSHVQDQLKEKSYVGARKKGTVGGAWGAVPAQKGRRRSNKSNPDSLPDSDSGASDDAPSHAEPPRQHRTGGAGIARRNKHTGSTSGANSDGTYERNVVTALCGPGGMRAVPPKDKLDTFMKSAGTLDADIVGPILEEFLTNSAWQVQSKALTVIECLLKNSNCDHFFDYFEENYVEIESCTQSSKSVVRDRSVKLLHVLGLSDAQASDRHNSGTYNAPAAKTDLLGGFEDAAPTQQNSSSLFDGLHHAQPPLAQAPVAQVQDMFGGLQLGNGSASNTASMSFDPMGNPQQAHPVQQPMAGHQQPQQPQFGGMQPSMLQNAQQFGSPSAMQGGGSADLLDFMSGSPMSTMGQPAVGSQYSAPGSNGSSGRNRSGSQLMGAAMTPNGIVKTIEEPDNGSNFNFMQANKPRNDSFSFVKDAMKKA